MNDPRPINSPAQDAVAPHQLNQRGLTLKPQTKLVEILIELPRPERRPRLRYPGPPRTLHIYAKQFPEPGRFLRVIGEPVIEISGERGFPLGIRYSGPQMGRD